MRYHLAHIVSAPDVRPPVDRHIAFGRMGWQAFAVGPAAAGMEAILRWSCDEEVAPALSEGEARFRVTVSVDHHKEDVILEAFVPEDERVVGRFDVRFPTVCQPLELILSSQDPSIILEKGLGLRMVQGEEPVWFVTAPKESTVVPEPLMPHLMIAMGTSPKQQFMKRMLSTASIQPFGWMEGAVLDGLYDLERADDTSGAREVIESHLHHFFDEEGRLDYVKSTSRWYGHIYGNEGLLPFAVIPQVWPNHPSVDEAITFLEHQYDDQGVIRESTLTAEGCYTVAYPLAILGNLRARGDFHRLAMTQLKVRAEAMFQGDHFYPQIRPDGSRPFKDWGRGSVWFFLGHVRTMAALLAGGIRPEPFLYDVCNRFAEWIIEKQAGDGTWSAYVTEPETGCDTSATAGLGAAIALGVLADILPESYMERAYRALDGLVMYLTPDGFLGNSAPENKGAEPLERRELMQRVAPRGISQMSMGMMLQLMVALRVYERS